MKRIALVTQLNADGSQMVSEDSHVAAALAGRYGLEIVDAAWEDPAVAWETFDAIVIRSTWNYHLPENAANFQRWLYRVSELNLWSPASIIRWNSDKIYLRQLEAEGVTIVPSVWREAGEPLDIYAAMQAQGWAEAVVKPRTGAGAFGFSIVKSAEDAARVEANLTEFAISGAVIQPLMTEVATEGEWSFLFFRGADGLLQYSHATRKVPASGTFTVQGGTWTLVTPDADLIAQAENVARAAEKVLAQPLLYARVDAIVRAGVLTLMELELIEPQIFLDGSPDTAPAERYLAAIQSTL